jgi:hypothetical protein
MRPRTSKFGGQGLNLPLERAVGNIRDATQQGAPGLVASDRAYNAVKDKIQKHAPAQGG